MSQEEILRLTIVGFDSMENREPQYTLEQKYFKSDGKLSAREMCAKYISTVSYKHHLGYDGEVYPEFQIKQVFMEKNDD